MFSTFAEAVISILGLFILFFLVFPWVITGMESYYSFCRRKIKSWTLDNE